MDMYDAPDFFLIDDLLDFSNDELFSSTITTTTESDLHHLSSTENTSATAIHFHASNPNHSTDFTDDLCVPNDDVAELEWLSNFVNDSFTGKDLTGIVNFTSDTSFHGRSRSKRSRAPLTNARWTSSSESNTPINGKSKTNTSYEHITKRENLSGITRDRSSELMERRCTHCGSEKTPQWRTGPLGPKTLCNACGVRFKSGRLVPEYRPAASPTFVLTQHSNSHRKVMELRRQKEQLREQQLYGRHHPHNFEVC